MDGVRGGDFHGAGEWLEAASIDETAAVYTRLLHSL
jgi:acetylornithine deacetylase/succinyl-diaminopimelate desuccinylase-like protein